MATSGWARTTGGDRYNRVGLSKTSGYAPLAIDAFFPAGGVVTALSLSYSTNVTVTQSDLLVKIINLAYNTSVTVSKAASIVYKNTLSVTTAVTSSLNKRITDTLNAATAVAVSLSKQVFKALNYSTNVAVTYADTVQFYKALDYLTSNVLTFAKNFIGGFTPTAAKLYRRTKFIMNNFGRW
jgi:hypothetical protein